MTSHTVFVSPRLAGAIGLMGVGLLAAYAPVFIKLVHAWAENDNYSHGFLIVPLAIYLGWERRERLLAIPARPSAAGLVLVGVGLTWLAAGTMGAELFIARVSLLPVIAGTIVFVFGWRHLRVLIFPLAFLLLMIPIPAILFNQIAFPLQLMASRFGEAALRLNDIPVLRQGNIITLAHATLEVAEACSGIRSLVSLLTLSTVYAHFAEKRRFARIVLILATVPIAILTNGLRVAAIGVAAHYYGPDAAEGWFHTVSGWLVFVVAFLLLLAFHRVLQFRGQHPAALVDSTVAQIS